MRYAAKHGAIEVAEALIAQGIDTDAVKDASGDTPFYIALCYGRIEFVKTMATYQVVDCEKASKYLQYIEDPRIRQSMREALPI